MKAKKLLSLALVAILAVAGLYGCKKPPFEILRETVNAVNTTLGKDNSELANPAYKVSKLIYEEATNTVKIEVPAESLDSALTSPADAVFDGVESASPRLAEAIQAADANVMVVFNYPDGTKQETMYENTETPQP